MARSNRRIVVEGLGEFTERQVKAVTLDATANLVEDTPRDTSWARNNWIPRIGSRVDEAAGSREDVGPAAAARERGQAEVATSYTLDKGEVFVSNNVPYIERLNAGHSKQAPSGFVEASILRAVRQNQ